MLFCLGVFAQDAPEPADPATAPTEATEITGEMAEVNTVDLEEALEVLPPGAEAGLFVMLLTVFLLPTIISLIPIIIIGIALWRILSKAGLPGWSILIPIYGPIMVLKACGKPWWWLFILAIPFIGWIILPVIPSIGLAKKFGKDTGFGILIWLLPVIGLPILGFGKAVHADGPAAADLPEAVDPEADPSESPSIRVSERASSATVPAKGFGIWAVLSIITALFFGTIITLQVLELIHYEEGPEKRSVWPAEGAP
jgi:hypothetical protein